MRIRTFQGPTIAEAMRQVREAMGEDAVIVSTHRSRRGRGVEVTAALEQPAPAPVPPQPAAEAMMRVETITRSLSWHGVPSRLIERLSVAAAREARGDAIHALAGSLTGCFGFQPLPTTPPRPLILIGPPGAGKTVTAAKLAARAVISGIRVTLITCDTVRAGGVDQLAAFTQLLKQQLVTVDTPAELTRALARAAADGPVIVDSPGTNPYSSTEVADLRSFVAAAEMDPVLVMPTGGDPAEAAEVATLFAAAGATRLLLTRVDASRRLGAALSAADAGRLRFTDVSITPFVAQGLHPLKPDSLARLLLRDPTRSTLETEFEEAAE